mgnify:FL=1
MMLLSPIIQTFEADFLATYQDVLPRSLSENADEELAFPFSFHGITPNRPTTILKQVIQTICYGIMAANNVTWVCT